MTETEMFGIALNFCINNAENYSIFILILKIKEIIRKKYRILETDLNINVSK